MIAAALLLAAAAQTSDACARSPADCPVPADAPAGTAIAPEPTTVVRARTPGDPHQRFNRRMFRAQQRFDRKVLRPAALGYAHAVPRPVRTGIRHALANLGEPIVFLNYLLQLKPGKAAETLGRFMINSTLGFGGVLDIAKTPGVRLPHRPNGFGDTLGYYGVKPGAYLFLPFVGPTTVRDLIGGQADGLVLPMMVGHPFDQLRYQIPRGIVGGLDRRAEADAELKALLDDAVDPYATLRSVYLQDRAGEIAALRGNRASRKGGELHTLLVDPAGADPATAPTPESSTPELQDPLADPEASPATTKPSP